MFNSRNHNYRSPMGAVAEGQSVHFKITMPREQRCSAATLVVRADGGGEERYGMFWCGMNGDLAEWWECDYTPRQAGLFFYHFEADTLWGRQRISRSANAEGVFGGNASWQLTVYQKDLRTPDWLAGGVMYQIFPDRFAASGEPKENLPAGRRYHRVWGELPEWEPDESGEITNRDYFGGDLKGVTQKLDYLQSLGVTCIYFNPVFESHSNHRYDTADYSKIDPLLGTEDDFRRLCEEAAQRGIRIVLDGVFNHTGSDSVYFNREGRYPSPGAYQSQESPYYPWYEFTHWPDQYHCWWGFLTLPDVCEENPAYLSYITGPGGIAQKWLACGASGWRLDVADELPDGFLDRLAASVKEQDPDALVLGEVWEDASNKIAYGKRRRYLLGGQLDSVMNYPFRNAILGFLTGADPAAMMEIIMDVLENYPPQVIRLLMNHIGTHDTERALTVLAGEPVRGHGRKWQSAAHLTRERRARGLRLMRLAALMQYTLPGVPCIYYGDEAGMEGYKDPFNRGCYPWGREETELVDWYRWLGGMRRAHADILREGRMYPVSAAYHCMAYVRYCGGKSLLVAVNSCEEERRVPVPPEWENARAVFGPLPDGGLLLPPYGCAVLLLDPPPAEEPDGAEAQTEPPAASATAEEQPEGPDAAP